jgi:hypothetical protein
MRKILGEPSRADVTFVLEESKVIHAHRCILLARCRSLEERVRQQGSKSEERDKLKWGIMHPNHLICHLPQFSQKAFLALMEYLYTD